MIFFTPRFLWFFIIFPAFCFPILLLICCVTCPQWMWCGMSFAALLIPNYRDQKGSKRLDKTNVSKIMALLYIFSWSCSNWSSVEVTLSFPNPESKASWAKAGKSKKDFLFFFSVHPLWSLSHFRKHPLWLWPWVWNHSTWSTFFFFTMPFPGAPRQARQWSRAQAVLSLFHRLADERATVRVDFRECLLFRELRGSFGRVIPPWWLAQLSATPKASRGGKCGCWMDGIEWRTKWCAPCW